MCPCPRRLGGFLVVVIVLHRSPSSSTSPSRACYVFPSAVIFRSPPADTPWSETVVKVGKRWSRLVGVGGRLVLFADGGGVIVMVMLVVMMSAGDSDGGGGMVVG